MISNNRNAMSRAAAIALALLVSACASHHRPAQTAHAPSRARPAAALGLSGRNSASVWRLRSGLNVAALTCRGRGRTSVAGDYRRLLSRHKGLLDAAYRQEEGRLGRSGFDRQQTKIYNRYANQRSPERFCQAASQVAKSANRMNSAQLAPAARGLVSDLERRLR